MRRQPSITASVALLLVSLAQVGCGAPRLYPVQGEVKIGGQPAAGVRVYFWPVQQLNNPPATRLGLGFTDSEGRFTVVCGLGQDGLERGEYAVTFSRMQAQGQSLGQFDRRDDAVESVPMPYCDHDNPRNSPIRAKVDGITPLVFEIPSQ